MTNAAPSSGIRDVIITPPSLQLELLTVVRVAALIAFGVWLYLANSPYVAERVDRSPRTLLPYQSLVSDRSADEQRMFRELQVGLLEAENVRAVTKSWPTADAMAADGIEPFAPNPSLKGPRYRWQMLRDGRFVNYLGTTAGDGAAAWLLVIQEPDPTAPEPFRADEEHHQLLDGSVLHVATWVRPGPFSAPATAMQAPQFTGWIQLFAVSPSGTHSSQAPP